MKPWQFALVGLALLATAGCRSDPAIPVLERELRLKEDEIYRLRATVDEMQDCGQSYSDRGGRSRSAAPAEPEADRPRHRSDSGAPGTTKPPVVELPSQPAPGMPDTLKTPAGSLPPGVPDVPENLRRPSRPPAPRENGSSRPFSKPAAERDIPPDPVESDGPALEKGVGGVGPRSGRITMASRSASAESFTPSGDSRHVAAIAMNRTLTGGMGADDRPGDQGLLVVVEPRNRAGQTVDAPAEMSVVVLDRALQGEAARVARWDFTAAEVAAMFRRTGSGVAIHLTTVWPGDPPAHNKLHLFVRYVTADGRKLEADQPIEVSLPGDKTARWNRTDPTARPDQADRRGPASESWQRDETPTARVPGPPPYTAARPDDARPRRPVWSPERR